MDVYVPMLTMLFVIGLCQQSFHIPYEPDQALNLRRRESIPLNQINALSHVELTNRRLNRPDDVNYRRTKEFVYEREQEFPIDTILDTSLRELDPLHENIEALKREIRPQIRDTKDTHGTELELKMDDKREIDRLRRELHWLAMKNEQGIGI